METLNFESFDDKHGTDVCDGMFTDYLQKTLCGRTLYECFASVVWDTICGLITKNCMGCQNDWPSQLDHHCLGADGANFVVLYAETALEEPTLCDLFLDCCKKQFGKVNITLDNAQMMVSFKRLSRWYMHCEAGKKIVDELLYEHMGSKPLV